MFLTLHGRSSCFLRRWDTLQWFFQSGVTVRDRLKFLENVRQCNRLVVLGFDPLEENFHQVVRFKQDVEGSGRDREFSFAQLIEDILETMG